VSKMKIQQGGESRSSLNSLGRKSWILRREEKLKGEGWEHGQSPVNNPPQFAFSWGMGGKNWANEEELVGRVKG